MTAEGVRSLRRHPLFLHGRCNLPPGRRGTLPRRDSPRMVQYGMTPVRRCRYPYDAYFAEGALYLSPLLLQGIPI